MISIRDKLKSNIPQYIVEEYPKFFDFIAAYYEWVEQKENPVGYIRNLKDNLDIDQSIDEFVERFKAEVLSDIPNDALTDKRTYLKFIDDIKSTKGSEESFKLLFRLLYGENISLYYPKEDILRVSDGKWIKNEIYLYVTDSGNPVDQYQNTIITQTRNLGGGDIEEALGLVSNVRTLNINNYKMIRLTLSDVVGEFVYGYPVTINNTYNEYIYPAVNGVTITTPGTDYLVNDAVEWPEGNYFEITGTINNNKKTDLFVTTTLDKSDLYVEVDSVDIVQDFEFDGRKLTLSNYSAGQDVLVRLPSLPGIGIVSSAVSGGVDDIVVFVEAICYNITHTVNVVSEDGAGAVVESNLGDFVSVPGRYKNTDGFLSSNKYLQDGDYYQEYSYVIRAGVSLENYSDVVKKMLHPAGMKMFGEINLLDSVILTLLLDDYSKALVNFDVTNNRNFLGPVLGSVQLFKLDYKNTSYPVSFFDDIVIEDVTTNFKTGVDFEAPPDIQFLFDGIDVDVALEESENLYNTVMFYMPNRVEEFEVVYPVWPVV